MGLFTKAKGSIISEVFTIRQKLGQFTNGSAVDVQLYEDHLQLSAMFVKQPITLSYSQITDVYYGAEHEIVEKNKSSIGRAVAGGLLFGGVGAIVGAVSGSGKKKKKITKFMFIISYTSSAGEEAFLQFEDTRLFKGQKVAKKLKELCGLSADDSTTITTL